MSPRRGILLHAFDAQGVLNVAASMIQVKVPLNVSVAVGICPGRESGPRH